MKLFIRHCGGSKWESIGEVSEISFETDITKIDVSNNGEEDAIEMAVEHKNFSKGSCYSIVTIKPNQVIVGK
jgi:hypothetical protein